MVTIVEETPQWIVEKISHYYIQGWTKQEIDRKFNGAYSETIRRLYQNYFGEGALGHKSEAYFENESDYFYNAPTYKDLSPSEKSIYRKRHYKRA